MEKMVCETEYEVLLLRQLPAGELAARYEALAQLPARTRHRDWLLLRCAYLIQARSRSYVQMDPATLERIARLIDEKIPQLPATDGRFSPTRFPPGNVFTAYYEGKRYDAFTLDDGEFFCNGKRYSSLSKLASEITKCDMSGLRFFEGSRAVACEESRIAAKPLDILLAYGHWLEQQYRELGSTISFLKKSRVSQLSAFSLLAPQIQITILDDAPRLLEAGVTERSLRYAGILREPLWLVQLERWMRLMQEVGLAQPVDIEPTFKGVIACHENAEFRRLAQRAYEF